MEKSKLVTLLKTLNKKELNELGLFLESKFHLKDGTALSIYTHLKKYYPEFKASRIEKQRIANLLSKKGKKITVQQLKQPMFKLTRAIEDFMLWKTIQNSSHDRDMLMLKTFQQRNLNKFFLKKVEEVKDDLEHNQEDDSNYYLNSFLLNQIIYRHSRMQKLATTTDSLKTQADSLDLFYCSTRLREQVILLNRGLIVKEEQVDLAFVDEIQKHLKKDNAISKVPILRIYNFFINCLSDDKYYEKKEYQSIKQLIFDNIFSFPKREQRNIIILLHQYALKLYNREEEGFLEEQFIICKFGVEHKILYEDNFIMPFIFFNLIQVACELNKTDWASQFIENNINLVAPDFKDNIKLVSKAHLSCSKGDYEDTLIYLRDVDYKKNYYFDLIIKTLTIRCYYELEEHDVLQSYLDSFYAFVRRHTQMSPYIKERLQNYLQFVNKLLKFPYHSKFNKTDLIESLSNEENIYFRTWLNQKVSELPNT